MAQIVSLVIEDVEYWQSLQSAVILCDEGYIGVESVDESMAEGASAEFITG